MSVAVFMVFIHNTVPPHPGIVGSTTLLGEDLMGLVTLMGILLAIPMGFLVYFAGKLITARPNVILPSEVQKKYELAGATSLGSASAVPEMASVSVTAWGPGAAHAGDSGPVSPGPAASSGPATIVILVTGAGGVFAKALTETGVGDEVCGTLVDAGASILLLAFLIAVAFEVAQGSGTVATVSAAGIVQGTVRAGDFSSLQVALIILAIGLGSVSLSHINDSGFWIATTFLGLSVTDGLRTWTVPTTILGLTSMVIFSVVWLIV